MFKTVFYTATGLAVAAFGPAIYYSAPGYWKAVRQEWLPKFGQSSPASTESDADWGLATSAPVEGAPVPDLAEVLRFDVTTEWLLRRWPRVATGLSYLQLQGYRVPLVTGTAETDLAGSLTYYFNSNQQVQRITFHGTTGDARKVVAFLTARYRFVRRLTNDPGVYVYEAAHGDGKRISALRVNLAGVVKASDPYRRFAVDLALERPET